MYLIFNHFRLRLTNNNNKHQPSFRENQGLDSLSEKTANKGRK